MVSLCVRVSFYSFDVNPKIRVSAANNAIIYNTEHEARIQEFPVGRWGTITDASLTSLVVWDAFFLHALILDHDERRTNLILPEQGDQASRLKGALMARTERFVATGREHWGHMCDICCYTNGNPGDPNFGE